MRTRGISRLAWGAFFAAGLIVSTTPSLGANCALYARAETGVALYGAAGGWWDQAQGRYARGHVPAVGAILVFRRTPHMPSGHVAVVSRVVNPREILVDHANWHRGTVSRDMSVIDTSPNHDWTEVAVKNARSGKYGRDNPAFGFVYPETGPLETDPSSDVDNLQGRAPSPLPAGLVQFAVSIEDTDQGASSPARRNGRHKTASTRHSQPGWTAHTCCRQAQRPVD
jgi:hypothetical protein